MNLQTRYISSLFLSVLLLLFLLSPNPADAAIAFDAGTTKTGNAASFTWSHTVSAATNRILILSVSIGSNAQQNVSTTTKPTYAGMQFTQINVVNNSAQCTVEMWYLINPPTGTNNIILTLTGAADMVAAAVSLSGVDQTNPLEQPTGVLSSAKSTAASVTVTTVNNNAWVFDALAFQQSSSALMTVYAGRQQQCNLVQNTIGGSGSTYGAIATGGTTVAMNWTLSANVKWAEIGVSLKPFGSPTIIPISIIKWQEVY